MKIAQILCFPLLFSVVVFSCNKKGDNSPSATRMLPVKIISSGLGYADTELLGYDAYNRLITDTTFSSSQNGMPTFYKVFYNGSSQQPLGYTYNNDTVLSSYDLLGRTNDYTYPTTDLAVKTVITDSNSFYQNPTNNLLIPEYNVATDSIFYSNQNMQKHSSTTIGTIGNGKDTVTNYYYTYTYAYTNYLNPFKDLMGYNLLNVLTIPAIPSKNLPSSQSFINYTSKSNCCNYSNNYSYAFDSLGRLITMVNILVPEQGCTQTVSSTITSKYYYQ